MYPFGTIVIVADFTDPQDRNPKNRRCIVVTPDMEAEGPGGTIDVVPIAGVRPGPRHPDHVPLPWRWPPHPVTKLIKASEAVCPWFAVVEAARVIEVKGKVPPAQMLQIAAVLRAIRDGL